MPNVVILTKTRAGSANYYTIDNHENYWYCILTSIGVVRLFTTDGESQHDILELIEAPLR